MGSPGARSPEGEHARPSSDVERWGKWQEKTRELCGRVTKVACLEIGAKDENATACELAKTRS